MRFALLAGLALMNLVSRATAHSWVHCTEASTSLNIQKNSDYADSACSGFPRNYKTYVQYNNKFGGDTGYNYQPSTTDPICRDEFSSTGSYASGYPMATYTPGQAVRVVWPAKNHQADTCTNPYIPDTLLKLYVNCDLTGTRKPTVSDFLSSPSTSLVIDWKANGQKGFQNCPDFCSDTGNAVCYEDFTVPSNLPSGSTCTFVWYWVFNSGTAPYTSCWEAQIGSGGSSSTPAPTTAATTPSPTRAPTASTPAPTASTPAPTKAPTTSTTPAPTTSSSSSTSSGTCAAVWNQCGGKNFAGTTCCATGNKCVYLSDWYSQCWPNNWRADSINAGEFSKQNSQEPSTTSLILMFVGSAVGTAIVVLSVGGVVIYMRRRGRQVSQQLAGASEVFIPMQSVE